MKIVFKIFILISLSLSLSFGAKISDIVTQNNLVLNGTGVRSKWFLDLYAGALYLKKEVQMLFM